MPNEVIEQYLHDPSSFGANTFCAYCRKQVPDRECTWLETGEHLDQYMRRLQQNHIPTGSAEVSDQPPLDLNVRGFLRYLAIILFVAGVVLPLDSSWREGRLSGTPETRSNVPRFGNVRSRFVDDAREQQGVPWYLKTIAVVSSIVALMLYLPRWGFKRYALLAGPIMGLGAFWVLGYWLSGRTTIVRYEPVLAGMLGALPGIVLWIVLVRIKARRLGLLITPVTR